MSYFQSLCTKALLGTSRDATPQPPAPTGLEELLSQWPASTPEATLLRASAAAALYERAGALPAAKQLDQAMAPVDTRPPCSKRAASLLARLLADNRPELLFEWLTACAAAGQRPPAALAPTLLDLAIRRSDDGQNLRTPVVNAVGGLGLWLAKLNPDWNSLVAEDQASQPGEIWQTGSRPQRLAALRRLRGQDPSAGRELLASTFATEPAADRAAFLDLLAISLAPDDETFLETALADRSKDVRAAAARLLARLAGSAYVGRMIARVSPCLTFTAGEPGKLLRRAESAQIEVNLPATYDDAMKRDGIDPKPPAGAGFGERQHWLSQMLALTPPSHWSQAFNATPGQLLDALPEEYADLIVQAWRAATENVSDVDWADAIVRRLDSGRHSILPLLKILPEGRRNDLIYDIIEKSNSPMSRLYEATLAGPLDVRCARLLIGIVARRARASSMMRDPELSSLLSAMASVAPPRLLAEFEQAWPADQLNLVADARDRFFATLTIRRTILQEFSR